MSKKTKKDYLKEFQQKFFIESGEIPVEEYVEVESWLKTIIEKIMKESYNKGYVAGAKLDDYPDIDHSANFNYKSLKGVDASNWV